LMLEHTKVFRAHAKHGCTVHFGLSAHEVRLLRVQVIAILILPDFFGVLSVV
jgi:hypothetical protein